MTTKTALITGASRGLGLALAQGLAQAGWHLLITARGADALEDARRDLSAQTQVVAIAGDVADASHRTALAQAAAELGGLDAIVNNAGILGPSPQPNLLDYPLDILLEVYRVNVVAPLGILQTLHPHLREGGRIINITSDAAVEPYEGWGGYGSGKAALEQLSAILAAENPTLRVYWVDPGDMQTQMHQAAFPGEDISDRPLPEESVPGLVALLTDDYASGRYRAREVLSSSGTVATVPEEKENKGTGWLNLVLTTDDYPRTVALFRDGLGYAPIEEWNKVGHGIMLEIGRATLEIADATQAGEVDRIEVGHSAPTQFRLALAVPNTAAAGQTLADYGATPLGPIVDTDWGHRNQRVVVDGVQVTLFQEIEK